MRLLSSFLFLIIFSIVSAQTTTVGSGAAINIAGAILSTGTLDIDGSGTFGSGTVNLTGNLDVSGEFSHGTSTVNFIGTSAQSFTSSGGDTLSTLVINNTSTGVTLNSPLSITTTATFTDGIITSTSTNLLTFEDDANHSTVSDASFTDGPVKKIGNDAFDFPIGSGSNYQLLGITAPSTTTDAFTAQYLQVNPSSIYGWGSGIMGTGVNHVSTEEYWVLTRDNGTSSVSATLVWDANSGGVNALSELLVCKWSGSKWESQGNNATTGNTTAGTIQSNAISSFSSFTLGSSTSNNALPIELISFHAGPLSNTKNLISWETASESNLQSFELEASTDGENFQIINGFTTEGNSNSKRSYEVIHEHLNLAHYYRLKSTDYDGSQMFSRITYVPYTSSIETQISIFPNPSKENVNIQIIGLEKGESIDLTILNQVGQIIMTLPYNHDQDNFISIDNFEPGSYWLRIVSSNMTHNQQLIIQP